MHHQQRQQRQQRGPNSGEEKLTTTMDAMPKDSDAKETKRNETMVPMDGSEVQSSVDGDVSGDGFSDAASASWEAGWCVPGELSGGRVSGTGGMRSAKNVRGACLSGFDVNTLHLSQWAYLPETDEEWDEKYSKLTVNAARATSIRGLELATMAEDWSPGDMIEYLNAQFLRSTEEGKMIQCYTETGDAAWAAFHTGLLSEDEFALFALFFREFGEELSDDSDDESLSWVLCGFVDDVALRDPSQPWNQIDSILHVPPRASFIDDELDHLWLSNAAGEEVVLEIDTQFWASLESKTHVFPPHISNASDRQRAGMSAVPRATRLASYGYCKPVPRYARLQGQRGPGRVQMMLPLKLNPKTSDTHGVIIVDIIKSRRGGRMYRTVGIASLREAVLTARVIGPVTAGWLRCDVPEDAKMEVIEPLHIPIIDESVDDKPAYASIATKCIENDEFEIEERQNNSPKKVEDWYKDASLTALALEDANPKVNLRILPFNFMQAVCKKLKIDDKVLRLSDNPSSVEFRVIQTVSVEASACLRQIMSKYGSIDRVYVGVSRKIRCFFAIVTFTKWYDIATRDAILNGENVLVKDFKCRERVYMRLSLEK